MSAEFRLSDEQRLAIASASDGMGPDIIATVESIVASEREAAERALVERIEAVLASWNTAGSKMHAVRALDAQLRAALTRPDTEGRA